MAKSVTITVEEWDDEDPAGTGKSVSTILQREIFLNNVDAIKWWLTTTLDDFEATVPKIEEYGGVDDGSADLRIMGRNMGELLGWPDEDLSDPVLQELAVWFYVQGKVGRLVSNYKKFEPGKADTWLDVTVYSMMARSLQMQGRWP